jgi:hypothetical protein
VIEEEARPGKKQAGKGTTCEVRHPGEVGMTQCTQEGEVVWQKSVLFPRGPGYIIWVYIAAKNRNVERMTPQFLHSRPAT